jgi:hypothetical protein
MNFYPNPDRPANHTSSNIGALYKTMTKTTKVKQRQMTEELETALEKVSHIPDTFNSSLIQEFYLFGVDNRKSDRYKNNNLKALVLFSHEAGPDVTFYDVQKKEKILEFLNKGNKQKSDDPDEKRITTRNRRWMN